MGAQRIHIKNESNPNTRSKRKNSSHEYESFEKKVIQIIETESLYR